MVNSFLVWNSMRRQQTYLVGRTALHPIHARHPAQPLRRRQEPRPTHHHPTQRLRSQQRSRKEVSLYLSSKSVSSHASIPDFLLVPFLPLLDWSSLSTSPLSNKYRRRSDLLSTSRPPTETTLLPRLRPRPFRLLLLLPLLLLRDRLLLPPGEGSKRLEAGLRRLLRLRGEGEELRLLEGEDEEGELLEEEEEGAMVRCIRSRA
jgi:hypothetical protein